jgi:transcriptional regulator with PAS, ATPase and Fis domain
MKADWIDDFSAAITVCDRDGIITEMNDKACTIFERYGGKALIGKSLFDCHPVEAAKKIKALLQADPAEKRINAYTIEKSGIRKLIYQAPWFDISGKTAGLVEISMEVPEQMQHFVRKPAQ